MVKVCINGGGTAGLSTALLLAQDGHDVTVVERDEGPPGRDPADAWERWRHPGVRQLRQTHAYLPLFRRLLIEELPHVWARLVENGVGEVNLVEHAPSTVGDVGARPGDEALCLLASSRATMDLVLHHAATDDPRIELLTGMAGRGLRVDGADEPRVRALETVAGDIDADVVVDASGSRSPIGGWIEAAGGRAPATDAAEFAMAYWTQWFAPRNGSVQPRLEGLPLVDLGPCAALRCPADNGWWSTTLIAPAEDARFRACSDREVLLRFLEEVPETAAWVDPSVGEPVGGIAPMFTPLDSRRRFVVDGRPCLGGLTGVGDAVGSTNPMLGRGASFALLHGVALRGVLREHSEPEDVTLAHHAWLEDSFHPLWEQTCAASSASLEAMRAVGRGEQPQQDPAAMFRNLAHRDPVLWRAFAEVLGLLATAEEVMARPEVASAFEDALTTVAPSSTTPLDVEALLAPHHPSVSR